MLRSLAKIAVTLNVDNVANRCVERFYSNTGNETPLFSRRFQILTYHKVSPDNHPFFEPIHPSVFEQQMAFLRRCYRVMRLQDLVKCSQQGNVPSRAVAITFDDGYGDNYEYAFPILKKFSLPATVFVATGSIGNRDVLWHDRVFDAFRYATVTRATLGTTSLPELVLESIDTQRQSLRLVLDSAKQLYGESMLRFVEEVERMLKPTFTARDKQRMLDPDQIREMHEAGIDFGSHTVTHPILSKLPHHELVKELRESKLELSELLHTPIDSFAYPNGQAGDYNDDVKAALKDCEYSCAVTTRAGVNRPFPDPFELKRGQPWQKEIELFRLSFFLERHGLTGKRVTN